MKPLPIEVKKECCAMFERGVPLREIYDSYFKLQFDNPQNYNSFTRALRRWRKKSYPSSETLEAGTYKGFVAHDATVQVSGDGEIVQAWIKQQSSSIDQDEFIKAVKEVVQPYSYTKPDFKDSKDMLEIPLFDMHWGIAFMEYYKPVLDDILEIITSKHWSKIVMPFGQDFFHNDSIVNGRTTKGTVIEKVDMIRAVKEGQMFMYSLVDASLNNSDSVEVLYSPGNHDRSTSWMFMQVLLERYGSFIVDDSMEFRKVISYGKNAIMITHGDSKQATPDNLAHIFPIKFPEEFSNATIREVHSGHLHTESEKDVYGVMVRRLSTGNKTDEWSDKEDFIGAHKRFMLFCWSLEKLKSIYYV